MPKELYLYSGIYDFTAETLIASLEENKSEDVIIRANSPGGSVFAGWGIASKMREHEGVITMKVDGAAASMAGLLLLFADKVEALDVSNIMLHRANMFVESEDDQKFLDKINKDIKVKMKAKIDSKKLKEIKGVSVDDIFSSEERIDVWLNAQEAKSIGLVDKIHKLTTAEAKLLEDKFYNIAASAAKPEKEMSETKITAESLKTLYPEVYKEVFDQGVAKEKDRVGAWLTFVDIDAKAVSEGIKEGKDISQTATAEFTLKAMSKADLENLKKETGKEVETEQPEGEGENKEEKEVKAFVTESIEKAKHLVK